MDNNQLKSYINASPRLPLIIGQQDLQERRFHSRQTDCGCLTIIIEYLEINPTKIFP